MRRAAIRIVAIVYFLSNTVFAYAFEANFWKERKRNLLLHSGAAVTRVPTPIAALPILPNIPSFSHARVRDVFYAPQPKPPFVFILQDVHFNTEAQINIAGTLESLSHHSNVPLCVGVEGVAGRFNFSRFRSFSDKKLRHALARFFLEENKIAAPSFLGLTASTPEPVLIGVDDDQLTHANAQAYKRAHKNQAKAERVLNRKRKEHEAWARKEIPPALLELNSILSAHRAGTLGLGDVLKRLDGLVEPSSKKDLILEQFMAAADLEKRLDYSQVDQQRAHVLYELSRKLSHEDIRALVADSHAYQAGRIRYADYYTSIKNLMDRCSLPLSRTPDFSRYIQYVLLADGIDADRLLLAAQRYEREITAALVHSPNEKRWIETAEMISLGEKLLAFSLTPLEWERYNSVRGSFWEQDHHLVQDFEQFYSLADARSEKLTENALAVSRKSKGWWTALVVGGFHTPRITNLLREKGVSFAVLQPKMTKVDTTSGSAYLSVFDREKTPIEILFEGPTLFLAPRHTALGLSQKEVQAVEAEMLVAQALGTASVPKESGVEKREVFPSVFELTGLDGDHQKKLVVTTAEAPPRGFTNVYEAHYPVVGRVNYLKQNRRGALRGVVHAINNAEKFKDITDAMITLLPRLGDRKKAERKREGLRLAENIPTFLNTDMTPASTFMAVSRTLQHLQSRIKNDRDPFPRLEAVQDMATLFRGLTEWGFDGYFPITPYLSFLAKIETELLLFVDGEGHGHTGAGLKLPAPDALLSSTRRPRAPPGDPPGPTVTPNLPSPASSPTIIPSPEKTKHHKLLRRLAALLVLLFSYLGCGTFLSVNQDQFQPPPRLAMLVNHAEHAADIKEPRDNDPSDGAHTLLEFGKARLIEDVAWVSGAKWVLLRQHMEQNAKRAILDEGGPLELPSIPVDRNQLPLRLVDSKGESLGLKDVPRSEIHVIFTDETTMPLEQLVVDLKTGGVLPPSGKNFQYLQLRLDHDFTFEDHGGQPLRDGFGRVVPKKEGYRVPLEDEVNENSVSWKDSEGRITAVYPTTGSAVPINPVTKNQVIFEAGVDEVRARVETAERNRNAAENRLRLIERQLNDRDHIAFLINKDYQVVQEFKTHPELLALNLRFFAHEPSYNSKVEFDPTLEPDQRPDLITDQEGHEIVFTRYGEIELKEAKKNARLALTATVGAWACGANDAAIEEAIAQHQSLGDVEKARAAFKAFMIKEDRYKKLKLAQTVEQASRWMIEERVEGRVMASLVGDPQFTGFNNGEITASGVTWTTSDSENFPLKMLEWHMQEEKQQGKMAFAVTPDKRHELVLNDDQIKLLHENVRRVTQLNQPQLKWGQPFQLNGTEVRLVPASVWRAGKERTKTEVQFVITKAQFDQLTSELCTTLESKAALILPCLAYKMTEEGRIVQVFHDPVELWKELKRLDLEYELNTGERVPLHRIPSPWDGSGVVVTGVHDPVSKTKIVTGSEWSRLRYWMNQAVRVENQEKGVPPVLRIQPGGGGDVLQHAPWDILYEQEWLAYLEQVRQQIEQSTNPTERNRWMKDYQQSLDGRTYRSLHDRSVRTILKGTGDQRIQQSAHELDQLRESQKEEHLRRSGGGVRIVPHNEGLFDLRIRDSLRRTLVAELNAKRAELEGAQQRLKRERHKGPLLVTTLKDRKSKLSADEIQLRKKLKVYEDDLSAQLKNYNKRISSRRQAKVGSVQPIFGDMNRYLQARVEQGAYLNRLVKSLAELSNRLDTLRKMAEDADRIELEIAVGKKKLAVAIKEDSWINRQGNKVILMTPLEEALRQAALKELMNHNDHNLLAVMKQLIQGTPVVVRQEQVKQPNGEMVTVSHVETRERMEAALSNHVRDNTDEWLLLDHGAVIHEVTDPQNPNGRYISLETRERGGEVKEKYLAQMKAWLQDPLTADKADIENAIQAAEQTHSFAYEENGKIHRWTVVHSLRDAEENLKKAKQALDIAEAQNKEDTPTVVTKVNRNTGDVELVTETEKLQAHLRRLADERFRLVQTYENLRQAESQEKWAACAKALRELESGVLHGDDSDYIVTYGEKDTKEMFDRRLSAYEKNHSDPQSPFRHYVLTNEHGFQMANVATDGETFLTTRARVLERKDNLTLVELRTDVSRGSFSPDDKGQPFQVTREWVNDRERAVAQVDGRINAQGAFEPRAITIHDFNEPWEEFGRASASHTYRYVEGLPFSDYRARKDLFIDGSRLLSSPQESRETGSILSEHRNASGVVWQELKTTSDRLIEKVEGVTDRKTGAFIPLRRVHDVYDDWDFELLKIPTQAIVTDWLTGEVVLGKSHLKTSFGAFLENREVRYERFLFKTQEKEWIVKNAKGQLLRKYTLVNDVPTNVTEFDYDYSAENAWVPYGLASRAYTYEVDGNGRIKGQYFEHTEIARVVPRKEGVGVVYRVSVRNGNEQDYEQFQEVKNGNGQLIEKQVGHKLEGGGFVPDEITLNGFFYNEGQFGKHDVADQSKTYFVRPSVPLTDDPFDLSNMELKQGTRVVSFDAEGIEKKGEVVTNVAQFLLDHGDVARLCVFDENNTLRFELTLKEQSQIAGIDESGVLTYGREVYRMVFSDGHWIRVVHSQFKDRISQGQWQESNDLNSGTHSSVTYDKKKNVDKGERLDQSKWSCDFSVGDLDTDKFKNTLIKHSESNSIVIKKLGIEKNQIKDVTKEQLINVLNSILKMPDFYTHITTDQLNLPSEVIQLLAKAKEEALHSKQLEKEALQKLNKSLLYAIYPQEIRETQSKHPSLLNGDEEKDRTLEKVRRKTNGVMENPCLPDLPEQFWHVFYVDHYERAEAPIYEGERWVNANGRTVVDTAIKKSETGQSQNSVAIYVSDLDNINDRKFELKPEKPYMELKVKGLKVKSPGQADAAVVDVSKSDFLYFYLQSDQSDEPWKPNVILVLQDTRGSELRVGEGGKVPFWIPVTDNAMSVEDGTGRLKARVKIVEESAYLGKRFVYAVPVRELAKHLVPSRLQARAHLFIKEGDVGQQVRVSDVYRAGRVLDERFVQETTYGNADKAPSSDSKVSQKGQTVFYDATHDSEEGRRVQIRAPDSRLLGVVRSYLYKSDQTGEPREERRLIVYDQSGSYPLAGVRIDRAEKEVKWDRSDTDTIFFDVRLMGNEVVVYEKDPTTNPRYPVATTFRLDALDPGEAQERDVGQFTRLPALQTENNLNTVRNWLENDPFYRFVRWLKGEESRTADYLGNKKDGKVLTAIEHAVKGLDPEAIQIAHNMLDVAAKRESRGAPTPKKSTVNSFASRFFSWPAALWYVLLARYGWLLIWSRTCAKRWRAWREELDRRKKVPTALLFDESLMLRALQHFNTEVLQTKVRGWNPTDPSRPIFLSSDGDIEGAFVSNLFLIYLSVFSWNEKSGRTEKSAQIMELDQFARAVARFLTTEVGRGSQPKTVRYPVGGSMDPQIWNKLEIFLSVHRDRLKTALRDDLATPGQDLFKAAYERLLETAPKDNNGNRLFNGAMMNEFIVRERLAPVPAVFITMGRHVFKMLPILLGMLVIGGGSITVGNGMDGTFAILWIVIVVALVLNAATEARAIRRARVLPPFWGRARAFLPIVAAVGLAVVLSDVDAQKSFALWMSSLGLLVFMIFEAAGLLFPRSWVYGGNRSLMGVTWWYHVRPPFSVGRARTFWLMLTIEVVYVSLGLLLGVVVLPWFVEKHAAGHLLKVALAAFLFCTRFPLLHHGINLGVRFLFSWWVPTLGPGIKEKKEGDQGGTVGVVHVGGNSLASPVVLLGQDLIFDQKIEKEKGYDVMRMCEQSFHDVYMESHPRKTELFAVLAAARADPRLGLSVDLTTMGADEAWIHVKNWFQELKDLEYGALGNSARPLISLDQMQDPSLPEGLKLGTGLNPLQQARVEYAFRIRQLLNEKHSEKKELKSMADSYLKEFRQLWNTAEPARAALRMIVEPAIDDKRLKMLDYRPFYDCEPEIFALSWFHKLHLAETMADEGRGTTLWSPRQLYDATLPSALQVGFTLSPQDKAEIEYAFRLRRSVIELTSPRENSMDSAFSFVDWAEALGEAGLALSQVFYLVHNQYNKHTSPTVSPLTMDTSNRTEVGQRVKLAQLLEHVSARAGQPGCRAYVVYNHTVFGMKSAAMNAERMRPEELRVLKAIVISDRNASSLDVDGFVRDIKRMRSNPRLAVIVARRNTTQVSDALGHASFAIDGGHGESMKALPDKIGTGWMNLMRVSHWDVMKEFGHPNSSFVSFEEGGNPDAMAQLFGLIGFTPNAVGISEDHWAVLQQYHNLVGLGLEPEVALSEGLGHKKRESRDYGEWENAPPRWSSGLIQTMDDLLNQQISEFGPDSLFEKEARQTNADHYLLGPLVLFDLFMMPMSVIFDLSPFVGISLLFWFPGMVFNQISTLNSLLASWRHRGFWLGTSYWFQDRVPDSLLFSARTVRDALAQIAGYFGPSFEFKMSGGDSSDNPMMVIWRKVNVDDNKKLDWGYDPAKPVSTIVKNIPHAIRKVWRDLIRLNELPSFLNTFVIGLILMGVNVTALFYLDATNAVMMILSLWFAVGVAFGPMLKARKRGATLWKGAGDWIAKIVGFTEAFLWMLIVAMLSVSVLSGGKDIETVLLFLVPALILEWLWHGGVHDILKSDNPPRRFERFVSEQKRGFWMFVLLFGSFVIVPVHPVIRFDLIPGVPRIFTPGTFAIWILVGVSLACLLVIIGTVVGLKARKSVIHRYQMISNALTGVIGRDFYLNAKNQALLTQAVTFVQQEAYRAANQALVEPERALKLERARVAQALQCLVRTAEPRLGLENFGRAYDLVHREGAGGRTDIVYIPRDGTEAQLNREIEMVLNLVQTGEWTNRGRLVVCLTGEQERAGESLKERWNGRSIEFVKSSRMKTREEAEKILLGSRNGPPHRLVFLRHYSARVPRVLKEALDVMRRHKNDLEVRLEVVVLFAIAANAQAVQADMRRLEGSLLLRSIRLSQT